MLFNEIAVVFFFPLSFALTVQKQNNGETENNGKEFFFIPKNTSNQEDNPNPPQLSTYMCLSHLDCRFCAELGKMGVVLQCKADWGLDEQLIIIFIFCKKKRSNIVSISHSEDISTICTCQALLPVMLHKANCSGLPSTRSPLHPCFISNILSTAYLIQ